MMTNHSQFDGITWAAHPWYEQGSFPSSDATETNNNVVETTKDGQTRNIWRVLGPPPVLRTITQHVLDINSLARTCVPDSRGGLTLFVFLRAEAFPFHTHNFTQAIRRIPPLQRGLQWSRLLWQWQVCLPPGPVWDTLKAYCSQKQCVSKCIFSNDTILHMSRELKNWKCSQWFEATFIY